MAKYIKKYYIEDMDSALIDEKTEEVEAEKAPIAGLEPRPYFLSFCYNMQTQKDLYSAEASSRVEAESVLLAQQIAEECTESENGEIDSDKARSHINEFAKDEILVEMELRNTPKREVEKASGLLEEIYFGSGVAVITDSVDREQLLDFALDIYNLYMEGWREKRFHLPETRMMASEMILAYERLIEILNPLEHYKKKDKIFPIVGCVDKFHPKKFGDKYILLA